MGRSQCQYRGGAVFEFGGVRYACCRRQRVRGRYRKVLTEVRSQNVHSAF
jgi:hypothetical protein